MPSILLPLASVILSTVLLVLSKRVIKSSILSTVLLNSAVFFSCSGQAFL
ncbi:hypothetical protein [Clostridium felsineum]|nr:hypothetical protein [Clostridium felsineum]